MPTSWRLVDQARTAPDQAVPLLPIITMEMVKMEAKGENVLDSYDELLSPGVKGPGVKVKKAPEGLLAGTYVIQRGLLY